METGGNSLPSVGTDGTKRKVCYFYDPEVGNYYYGQGHPMKPHRIRMTHSLLAHYGLLHHMQVLKPHPARERDLCRFHADDYISFLRSITPEMQQDQIRALKRFNVGEEVKTPTDNDGASSVPRLGLDGSLRPIDEFLRRLGLWLRPEWLGSCVASLTGFRSGFEGLDVAGKARRCFEQFLLSDMNRSGAGVLPENVHGMHRAELEGPFVLQVIIRNVHIRRGLLMLVPEVLEVLGGQVDDLEAARQRLVGEVNKPPRSKRKQCGLPLSRRASLAAWPSDAMNNGAQANIPIQSSKKMCGNLKGFV